MTYHFSGYLASKQAIATINEGDPNFGAHLFDFSTLTIPKELD